MKVPYIIKQYQNLYDIEQKLNICFIENSSRNIKKKNDFEKWTNFLKVKYENSFVSLPKEREMDLGVVSLSFYILVVCCSRLLYGVARATEAAFPVKTTTEF